MKRARKGATSKGMKYPHARDWDIPRGTVMTTDASRIIEFELPELICIENSLAPSQTGSAKSNDVSSAPTKETCLKVGAALLEALDTQSPAVAISFDEDELWMLRERLSIYTSQGPRMDLGLVVKSKVYAALLSIGNERAAEAAIGGTLTAQDRADAELSREEVDDAIRRWQEKPDYRRNPVLGSGGASAHRADDDPEDETGTRTPVKS